jgi:3-methyladenine DNA glycosylase AlkD
LNNWDIIDSSAHKIVGPWLQDRDRKPIYDLAKSRSLWDRRIAIISTYYYIRQADFSDTLKLAAQLHDDTEDLIHKAVGWMLREVGNRDRKVEERFLATHYKKMPRTMLRYAIEKFPERQRKAYLNGTA